MNNVFATDLTQLDDCKRILLVDDAANSLYDLLVQADYQVCQASSAKEAVQLIRRCNPTLVLVDVSVPKIDGQAILQAVKAEFKESSVPIVILGLLQEQTTEKMQSFRYGAADYVSKHLGPDELLTRIHYQVGRQLTRLQQERLNADLESRLKERDLLLDLARDQLLDVALSDRLTQLPNRLSFVKQLSKVMAQCQGALARSTTSSDAADSFAVLFLDCDRFKRINDSLGHRIGDLLLRDVAERLLSVQKAHPCIETVARFGGDEFALLVRAISDRTAVAEIAKEVLARLASPFTLADREIYMSASIGMVWGDVSYTTPEHILRDADMAMYQAKECHRSQYHWFESDMHHQAVDSLQLETDLHLALARKEFELYYQPIVDLSRLKIVGFEALVRWHHPTKGLVLPGEFIDFAEESGFIIELGHQVLEMACADIARWIAADAIGPEITVNVNMAAQQLLQPDILEQIYAVVDKWGIEHRRLHLELTERSVLNSHAFIDDVLANLQRHSIQLSIDDFGTGYSALSYLHTLPVNCLKVDRSFVQPITEDPSSLGIVPLIINIAKTMNMKVVAEGIENEVQLSQLQKLGCMYGQGFLFQRAVSAEQAIALLSEPTLLERSQAQPQYYSPEDMKASA